MSILFPPTKKGIVLRIYHSRPWKNAYVFIMDGKVTHASEELVFTLGWTSEKVVAQAEKVGFKVSRQMNVSKPRDTWLSARPAPVQLPMPAKWEDMGVSPQKPKRDSKGRFISTKPKKKKDKP